MAVRVCVTESTVYFFLRHHAINIIIFIAKESLCTYFNLFKSLKLRLFHNLLIIHSGGHVNPCTIVAAFLIGRITLLKGIVYSIAQMIGAIIGAAFLGVCMYVRIHTCVFVSIYSHVECIRMYVRMYACMHVRMYVVCMHACMYVLKGVLRSVFLLK